ncbi:MAG: type I glyceraldehyde-3-phosphate dehydrogenase [Bacteroidota bacterium]
MIRVGINGFGRIGRVVFRNLIARLDIELVAVNDIMPIETLAYLLKYDSNHGICKYEIQIENQCVIVNGKTIIITQHQNPIDIPWKELGVDIVLESSGRFKTKKSLENHLKAGAKKVILSCPPDDELDKLVVFGINQSIISEQDKIISNASCTTNCIAPVIKVLEDEFGIEKAMMNTVHPFTNNQKVLDSPHSDIRRSRALGVNIIPTTSTAIDATIKIFPFLKNKFDGIATRVPVKDGSLIELTAVLKTNVTVEQINAVFKNYSENKLSNILEYTDEPLVSSDIIGNPNSAIFDSLSTKVVAGNMIQIIVWYDNEVGYSSRIIDLILYFSKI